MMKKGFETHKLPYQMLSKNYTSSAFFYKLLCKILLFRMRLDAFLTPFGQLTPFGPI